MQPDLRHHQQRQLKFLVFVVQSAALVFLWFMRRPLRQSKRKVFLIVDEDPLHTFAPVTRSVQRHPTRLACSSYRTRARI